MRESTSADKENTRTRHLAGIAAMALLLACGVVGCVLYLERQATTGNYAAQDQSVFKLTQGEKAAHLAKAKLLREKWRPWAEKHKELLQRMLRAQSNDQTTLMTVYRTLPSDNIGGERGITSEDLVPRRDLRSAINAKVPLFTWQAQGNKQVRFGNDFKGQAELKTQYDASQRQFMQRMQQNWIVLRDVEISVSMNPGPSRISLWASGRVTESDTAWKPFSGMIDGKPVKGVAPAYNPHRELTPPYDFLSGKIT